MIGLFKRKSPANIVVLFIVGLLIKMPLFLYPKPVQTANTDGVLYTQLVVPYLNQNSTLIIATISFALLYVQALFLNYLVNEYRLTTRLTYLPAMAYLLLTSLLPEWNYFSAALLANTFFIWAFIRLYKLYTTSAARGTIYDTGLIVGLCSFIFFPALFVAFCMLLGIIILRPFRLNELFLLLLGVFTPLYFYAVYLFLNDNLHVHALFPALYLGMPVIKNPTWLIADAVLLIVPFLLGGYYIQMNLHKMLIQVRKNWSILLIYFLLAVFIPFINFSAFTNWVLVVVPLSAFHAAAYFYLPKKWVSLALFFTTVIIILVQQYATTLWH